MHANRVCRYVLIIACRLGPFSLSLIKSCPVLKGSKRACSVSYTVDVRELLVKGSKRQKRKKVI